MGVANEYLLWVAMATLGMGELKAKWAINFRWWMWNWVCLCRIRVHVVEVWRMCLCGKRGVEVGGVGVTVRRCMMRGPTAQTGSISALRPRGRGRLFIRVYR